VPYVRCTTCKLALYSSAGNSTGERCPAYRMALGWLGTLQAIEEFPQDHHRARQAAWGRAARAKVL